MKNPTKILTTRGHIWLMIILGVIVVVSGCSRILPDNNRIVALRIYSDTIPDPDNKWVRKERERIFLDVQGKLKGCQDNTRIPVNDLFKSLPGRDKEQIAMVKKWVRHHVKDDNKATEPKTVLVGDMKKIVQFILNDFYTHHVFNRNDLDLGR